MNESSDVDLLRGVIDRSRHGLVDRDSLVETLILAAVAGEHVLVVGPPGTAKSQAVRRVANELGGSYFEYLLGRFTEPNEIFGPVDLRKLREGIVEIETTGMLPEAEVAFLDEVFLGSTAILNTLLGVLNERVFRRGATVTSCPLRLCVGATNSLPDDVSLAAFADRFLVRIFVEPVPDSDLEALLEAGWASNSEEAEPIGLGAIDRLVSKRSDCDMSQVQPVIATAVRRMRSAGIELSDRRAVRCQALVAAATVLDGRTTASGKDLWPLPLVVPTAEGQPIARQVLADLLDESASKILPNLAEELSAGPVARANRFLASGQILLGGVVGEDRGDTKMRAESLLREIDASLGLSTIPEDLRVVRDQLMILVTQDGMS